MTLAPRPSSNRSRVLILLAAAAGALAGCGASRETDGRASPTTAIAVARSGAPARGGDAHDPPRR
ncbi:MAG TPA: hypothetical protein VL400_25460, partial [Polyangiaceae bacterium]|nr:hypothetical protein [Polyangiaceae bacterium]